jgi:hypothetical protein
MRSPVYAWSSGEFMHLWVRPDEKQVYGLDDPEGYHMEAGVAMRSDLFDALVLMRYAELKDEPKSLKKAMKWVKKNRGNYGSWALRDVMGEDPDAEFAAKIEEAS